VSPLKIRDPRDILLAPIASEKSYNLIDDGKYQFLVAPNANKTEIKSAVEQVFGVTVLSVNTQNRSGKRRRTRYGWGNRPNQRRAVVTLAPGQTIDIFSAPAS
jgi:large subunit ribosomal protein L23